MRKICLLCIDLGWMCACLGRVKYFYAHLFCIRILQNKKLADLGVFYLANYNVLILKDLIVLFVF